jgi:hypothetical protein
MIIFPLISAWIWLQIAIPHHLGWPFEGSGTTRQRLNEPERHSTEIET